MMLLAIVGSIIVALAVCGVPSDPSAFAGSLILHSSVHVNSNCGA